MKKFLLLLLITTKGYSADFTVQFSPENNSVSTEKIQDGAITASKIANESIDDSKVSSISISKVQNLQNALDNKLDKNSIGSVLSKDSDIMTPPTSGFINITNGGVVLTEGTWDVSGTVFATSSGGNPFYNDYVYAVWGNGSWNNPAAWPATSGIPGSTGLDYVNLAANGGSEFIFSLPRKIVVVPVGQTQPVHIIPRFNITNPFKSRISTNIVAIKIK